jgi:hypothetical protein
LGRSQLLAEVGLAILSSPVLEGRQTDPFTYGVAAIVPTRRGIDLVAEISGRQGPPNRLGNENHSQLRAGVQFWIGGIRWDLTGVAGFLPYDPTSGIGVWMNYEFQAFQRNDSPVKIK